MSQPGGVLVIVGMMAGLGGMFSVMLGNLVIVGPPIPCLIISLIAGIIATALGAAAWTRNKAAKGVVAFGIMDIVVAIVIGLMWATAFG